MNWIEMFVYHVVTPAKIAAPDVIKIIYSNRVLIEPFIDAVHEELLQYSQTK